jgi:hypothetical protein
VRRLLDDREALATLRRQCVARLQGHRYRDRLAQALSLATTTPNPAKEPPMPPLALAPAAPAPAAALAPAPRSLPLLAGRRPAPARLEPLPFDAPPRRNLLYHLWPVRGSTWRWNLDELKRRIDLFNGRRIVGIVCDARSEDPQAVQDYLAGHGCEFIVAGNDERGEAVTFAAMLQRVASTDRNEVSFYAHAKGVKYEPEFPPAVRRWTEVLYGALLDDWAAVREQLQLGAMTGMLRKHGRFRNHHEVGDWHYSGTFFWMRHAHVFRRRWQEVPQFYGGVEAWPGTLFHRDETGCLLLDQVREWPYSDRFWSQRGDPAYRQWRARLRPVPVPPDLATPRPFEGHVAPRLEHKPEEFAWWVDRLLQDGVRRLLMVGSGWGGEEWHIARRFHAAGREIEITTLADEPRREWHEAAADAQSRFGRGPALVRGNAFEAGALQRLPPQVDAVFIDGDHGYRACSEDLRLARRLQPRWIGLHDIVDSDWHAHSRCCVSRVWAEASAAGPAQSLASGDWGGIGLLRGG